jgi:7-keto-8-aminopelargonate synthetase-like enzyme
MNLGVERLKPAPRAKRSIKPRAALAEPLQQIDRTFVLRRGRKLAYFAGCDYFRLASHPKVLQAVHEGLERFGLNVAASRKTTGNHVLYGRLEQSIARFFDVEAAVLISNGYMANSAATQALNGESDLALIDERSHGSLLDASKLLDCPVRPFKHRDPESARQAARSTGRRARILLLTDGLYSHSGEVAPLNAYLRFLPANARLLVDDAHGAGTLGGHGRGTTELLGVSDDRLIRTITLSKAFGVYGGAVIGPQMVREKIIARSRVFVGNTPLPLPLAFAALVALEVFRGDASLRHRLASNTRRIKTALREAGFAINDGPGPIIPFIPTNAREAARLEKKLSEAGIHPPLIHYPGGPAGGYFRFVICSEHTAGQIDGLIQVLSDFVGTLRKNSGNG